MTRRDARARAIATLAWATTMACGTAEGAEGRRGTSTRADGTFFDAGARGWLKRVGEETTTTTGVNAGELVVVARAAVGLTSPSVDAGAIDARDDVVRTVLDEERRFFAAGDDDETRRRRFLTLSADESVWRTGEVEFSAIEGVVARDVSFDGSRSRTTLRETAKAIARGGRCEDSETRELFDRRVCFGEEVVKRLEKSDVDASARVKGFVERELKCFEEGVEAFASERGGDEPKFAYVALEGATYASKKFGSKSDIALWSAKETKAAVARVMASMAKKDGFEFGALALASRDPERSTRGSERKLLGIDHRRSLLANSTSSDENDDAVVARFMRKGVAWAVAIIFIGAAVAGVLAIMGMPLQKEPFLYTAIPGVKLD